MRGVYWFCGVGVAVAAAGVAWLLTLEGPAEVVQEVPGPSAETVASPDGALALSFVLSPEGEATYRVTYRGKLLISDSLLAMRFKASGWLRKGLVVDSIETREEDHHWQTLWGERTTIRDHYRELTVGLREAEGAGRRFGIRFRVFDDGIAFRYEFPRQKALQGNLSILQERSHFVMTGDHEAWWIPADYDSYEHLYSHSRLSDIDGSAYREKQHPPVITIKEAHAVNTPVTLKTEDGVFMSLHEAALADYSGMTLRVESDKRTLESSLVPSSGEAPVTLQAPFVTPWRTLQVGDSAAALATSSLILNLNAPPPAEDVAWIKPGKYAGIWWGMHLDRFTWSSGNRHGATTQRARAYIDFAAHHGLDAVLVEGWNTGWETWRDDDVPKAFDFVTPYPDFDLPAVVAYGKRKGVSLIGHHETAGDVANYERHLENAFALYGELGVPYVKTGYVGRILPQGEHHHGQWMVKHYRRVVEFAAKHRIMLIAHEPIKPTGIRRTFPNMMSAEGARGSEFNAPWGGGNPPEHLTILPFTRVLAGPLDITPGLVKLHLEPRDGAPELKVPTTVANQLAQYVVIYSPLHMLADLPEHYAGHPALPFLKAVPTDWGESHFLAAEIGDFVVVARKDRHSATWYLGALTDEHARDLAIPLTFLPREVAFMATSYLDGEAAHFETNPEALQVQRAVMHHGDVLKLHLAPGGGAAVVFNEAQENAPWVTQKPGGVPA